MKLYKQEIEEEIKHKRQIISALRCRCRPLELQAAQKGLSAPPEILTEIITLNDQMNTQEQEISELEIMAVEGELPIIESKYKIMVARAWDNLRGKPTIAESCELELLRLQKGLVSDRTQQIESEIRKKLAEESFSSLDIRFLELLPTKIKRRSLGFNFDVSYESKTNYYPEETLKTYEDSLRIIGRAIRLDYLTAIRLLLIIIPLDLNLDIDELKSTLLRANKIWNYQEDHEVFDCFFRDFIKALESKTENQTR